MRFNDSLTTVLAADTSTVFGARSAWRQLVDLIARGRVGDADAALARLRALREQVPAEARAASARAMALADPPAALVALFAEDDVAIAAPALRTASLSADDWLALLPRLSPAMRAVLRHRADLPPEVQRGLDSFGATDFVLADDRVAAAVAAPAETVPSAPLDETPFVTVGEAARAIPVVVEALKQAAEPAPRFEIADLVARIDAFQRTRAPSPPAEPEAAAASDHFRFATDGAGVIRWVDGVPREPLIGVSLAYHGPQGAARLDAAAGGALRGRSAFRDVRLEIGGGSPVAGNWRLAGQPGFDPATGRFTGMTGVARRARADQGAAPAATASDQLRQLVHELRTPANAIAGFAELIGSELLGPVAAHYRDRALLIQRQAGDLLGAIDDLDTAARIEGHALDLRPGSVDLAELARRAVVELGALTVERGAALAIEAEPAVVLADDRAAQRLVTRLLATLLAAAAPGERLRIQVTARTRSARLSVTRPRALAAVAGDALLAIDADADRDGEPLLGTAFALRLARNLAAELGGRLAIEEERLTLRLPLARSPAVAQTAVQ